MLSGIRKLVLVILPVLFGLSGCTEFCLLFNGEGYCGVRGGPPDGPVSEPQNLEIKLDPTRPAYYWNVAGYTCKNSAGELLASHRGVIQFMDNDKFVAYGDRCSPASRIEGGVDQLERFGNIIGFGDGIYEKGGGTGHAE